MSEPKYPDIEVQLIGEDGNALSIVGKVQTALKKGGAEDHKEFWKEALSGNYDNVLFTVMKWVTVK